MIWSETPPTESGPRFVKRKCPLPVPTIAYFVTSDDPVPGDEPGMRMLADGRWVPADGLAQFWFGPPIPSPEQCHEIAKGGWGVSLDDVAYSGETVFCPVCPTIMLGKKKDKRHGVVMEKCCANYSGCGIDYFRCPDCAAMFEVSYKIDAILPVRVTDPCPTSEPK